MSESELFFMAILQQQQQQKEQIKLITAMITIVGFSDVSANIVATNPLPRPPSAARKEEVRPCSTQIELT